MYFGVFAKDDEPGRIIVNDLKKDFNTGTSDGFRVILDTFPTSATAISSPSTRPARSGTRRWSNEGRENNANWDGIWDVRDARSPRRAGTRRSGFRSGR